MFSIFKMITDIGLECIFKHMTALWGI